jgi:hypothetical protein
MAWAPDTMTDRLPADEVGSLERAKLLKDACPAGSDSLSQLVR